MGTKYILKYLLMTAILLGIGTFFYKCNNQRESNMETKEYLVYVGTYTDGGSKGIYLYRLDTASGELRFINTTGGVVNPSFLAIHPSKKFLYSVESIRGETGNICSFVIDRQTGELSFNNKQSSEGIGPCHVIVDNSGKWVLAANYNGGTVSILPVNEDGSLGLATDHKVHSGSSVNTERQNEAHPHSIWISPDNRFAIVPDLGIDKLVIYKLDLENGKLNPNDPNDFQTAPGAGPRHFTFHPNGRYGVVINELNSTITSLAYDPDNGSFKKIQTVSTLPENFTGTNTCADVHFLPNGKFVYGSNRGHDSIAVIEFDDTTGKMSVIEYESTQGSTPRNFAIDPSGQILLAANQRTGNVVTFWIDQKTGELTPTGFQTDIPSAVCLKLLDL
jgi:6-phosphogluconolactonase